MSERETKSRPGRNALLDISSAASERMNARLSRRRMLQGGVGLLALAYFGTGCGSDGSSGSSGGTTQVNTSPDAVTGTIRFDTYEDWIGPNTIKDFEKKYPDASVKSNYYAFPADRVVSYLGGDRASDMMFMELTWMGGLLANDEVAQLDLDAIPNYEKIDSRYKIGPFSEEERNGVVLDTGRYGIGFRSDQLDAPVESWADFFDMAKQHPGRFSLEDYSASGVSVALAALGLPMRSTDPADIDKAKDLLIESKSDLGPLWQNTPVKSLVDGDTYAALMWDLQAPTALSKGDSIRWAFPTDGVLAWYEGYIAMADSKVLDAVHAFMNFALEPKYYAAFVNYTLLSNLMPAAKSMVDPTIADSKILNPSQDVIDRTVPQLPLGPAQRLYDDAWNSFKAA